MAWVSGALSAPAHRQVDGWIGAAAMKLTRRDLDEIAAAIVHSNAGTGPGKVSRPRALKRNVA